MSLCVKCECEEVVRETDRERDTERERERLLNISLITRKNNSVFIYVIIRFILFIINYSFFIIFIFFLHYSLRNLLRLIFFCQSWG